ncbi:MAG: hypothetical protein RR123_01345 [Clostridia bacterium]
MFNLNNNCGGFFPSCSPQFCTPLCWCWFPVLCYCNNFCRLPQNNINNCGNNCATCNPNNCGNNCNRPINPCNKCNNNY